VNEYSVDDKHLRRKNVDVLRLLLVRDARLLAWRKARLLAAEEAIRRADKSYVSRHGLGLGFDHSLAGVSTQNKKGPLKDKLAAVRNEMSRKGRLHHNQAQGSWEEVFGDLVSTYHLDRAAVGQRAEQSLHRLRLDMSDNMADNVTAATVELTHQLTLVPGASLPPKY
jgi:hypothetical protein